jgi:tRNA(fMet)-specific endonuclease VapC
MILDTNALSAFADGSPQLGDVLAAEIPTVPVIVLGEYRYGITHSTRKHAYEAWLDRYLPMFRVLDITMQTTLEYAVIRSELRHLGKPIPANDVWIAALCRQHDLPLLSRDAHFDCVKGLRRVDWRR